MHHPATESPTREAPDFAGLLSALTAGRKREPSWNDEDLAEDVATLSYESALRTHTRYRPPDHFEGALAQLPASRVVEDQPTFSAEKRQTATKNEPAARASAAIDRDRKSASITIRLSRAECDQLHRRAAEAGLTMSAYLRSCTLEAESLRAQVKQALAEMKKAGTEGTREQGNEKAETRVSEPPIEKENESDIDGDREAALQHKAATSRITSVFHPIRGLRTRLLHRTSK